MSSVLSLDDLELALVERLHDSDELADVETFERDVRAAAIFGESFSKGFDLHELPAIQVSMQLSPQASRPRTASRIERVIPTAVFVVTSGEKEADARAVMFALQHEVERLVHKLRCSTTKLTPNVYLTGDVTNSNYSLTETSYSYAVSTTEFSLHQDMPL